MRNRIEEQERACRRVDNTTKGSSISESFGVHPRNIKKDSKSIPVSEGKGV